MQKIVRRTALARNQAQRKSIKANKAATQKGVNDALKQRFQHRRIELDNYREEKIRRREDWMRGPLAPHRDAGEGGDRYGALPPQLMRPPEIPKNQRRRYINFAPGDRVCIMKGRDKGNIGEVSRVEAENETVTVKDFNVADVWFPQWMNEQTGGTQAFQPIPIPISIDDVRLVAALDDPATGQTRDVIVDHMRGGGPLLEHEHGVETPRHTRYIAGEDIEIPWPRSDKPNYKDEEWDTLRMEVETPTWTPSLHNAPFPSSVLDELRNKYSKYRTRHDPAFVKEKRLEDLKKEYLAETSLMTPRGELKAMLIKKKAEERAAKTDENGNLRLDKKTKSFVAAHMRERLPRKTKTTAENTA